MKIQGDSSGIRIMDRSLPASSFCLCKSNCAAPGFGGIWHCRSRDAHTTTKGKVVERQSWEEAVVEGISPVAVVALFCVLWDFWTLLQVLGLEPEQNINQ